ncbi:MAG TPA: flippase [Candidatus Limnocylindrales bacterium]|nr:flippase [Candidatus Limnocylindrales bacterium]
MTSDRPGLGRDLSQKAAWSMGAQAVSLVAGLAVVIITARVVGPAGLGEWRFAQAIAAYVLVFGDLGLSSYATREIARDPSSRYRLLVPALVTRVVVSAVVGALALIALVVFSASPSQLVVTAVVVAAALLAAATPLFLLQGQERIATAAMVRIVAQVVAAVLAIGFVLQTAEILPVVLAYFIGAAVSAVWTLYLAARDGCLRLPRSMLRAMAVLASSGLPFLGTAVSIQVLTNGDSFLLGLLRGPEELGLYAAPYAVASYIMLVGGAIMAAIFPRVARVSVDGGSGVAVLIADVAAVNGSIGIPVALGGMLLSATLMPGLFGPAYAGEGPVFALLMAYPLLGYLNLTIGQTLAATGGERPAFAVAGIAAGLNIVLNLWLIPPFGRLGCAIAVAVTEVVSLLLYAVVTPGSLRGPTFSGYVSIVPVAVVMGLAVAAANYLGWPWFVGVATGAVVFVAAAAAARPRAYRLLRDAVRSA